MASYTAIVASNLMDLSGRPFNGRVTFTGPVNAQGQPVSAATSGNGVILYGTRQFVVANGFITGDTSQPQQAAVVADTSQTNPKNIGYTVQFYDTTGKRIPMPGFLCVQPTGPVWALDQYVPPQVPLSLIQLGPIGLQGATGSPGSFGPATKTAKQLGCVGDGVTDDTALINAFFVGASASNPKTLLLDCVVATTGVILASNGYCGIIGQSKFTTGFKLLPNSGRDGIRNGDYSLSNPTNQGVPGATPPSSANSRGIVLKDFFIDCTGNPVQTPANVPISGAPSHQIFGVHLQDASDCLFENVVFTNPPAYCTMLSNTSRIHFRSCSFTSGGYTQDGVHINGPGSYIDIDDCDFATGDDAVAINAPEGYGGTIDTVRVTNCRFQNSYSVARIYTSNNPNLACKVRQVLFANLIGVVQTVPFNIGLEPYLGQEDNTPVEQVEDVRISNCSVFGVMANDQSTKQATVANIMTTVGSMTFNGYTQRSSGSGGGFNLDPPFKIRAGAQIADLAIHDYILYRDAHGNGTPSCIVNNLGTIGKLTMRGIRVVDADGTYTQLNCLIGNAGPIGTLMLSDVDSYALGLTISNGDFSQVTSVGGSSVLSLPNEVPDAKMLSGFLYRSADVHALSCKIGSSALRIATTS